jgi:hypothetical protein
MKQVFCRDLLVTRETVVENFSCRYEGTSGGFKEVILKLAVKMFTELEI